MNKQYKVVFSKTRGALMVVNELTGCVQAKGSKIVVTAAAVALTAVAGSAVAEQTTTKIVSTPAAIELVGGETGGQNAFFDVTGAAVVAHTHENYEGASATGAVANITYTAGAPSDLYVQGGTFTGFTVKAASAEDKAHGNGSIFDFDCNHFTVHFTDSVFTGNTATNGGVGRLNAAGGDFVNTIFAKNKSDTAGALYISGGSETKLTNVRFEENASTATDTKANAAGALYVFSEADAVTKSKAIATNVVFLNNDAGKGNGGAVTVKRSVYEQTGGRFEGNKAASGGAFNIFGGSATFTDVDFVNNTATAWGGAMQLDEDAEVTIAAKNADVVISGNRSGGTDSYTGNKYDGHTGGAFYLKANSTLTFDAAAGRTITVGTGTSNMDDSFASQGAAGNTAKLVKTGAGALVVNADMSAFLADIDVEGGVMDIAGSVANYAISKPDSFGSTATVKNDAQLIMHDFAVTRRIEGATLCEGFSIDVQDTGVFKGGTLTIAKADEKDVEGGFSSITVGKDASATLTKLVIENGSFQAWGPGRLTIGDVEIGQGKLTTQGGAILRIDGTVTMGEQAQAAVVAGTTLETGYANLFVKNEAGKYELSAFGKTVAGDVVETSYSGTYTLDDLTKARELFTGNFAFEKAEIRDAQGGNLGFDAVKDLGNVGQSTVTAADPAEGTGAATVDLGTNSLTMGAFVVTSNTTKLEVSGESGKLTLRGDAKSGKLIAGNDTVKELTVAGGLTLGNDVEDKGVVNVEKLTAKTLDVAGDFNAGEIVVTEGLGVTGNFAADKITAASVNVEGALDAKTLKVTGAITLDANAVMSAQSIDNTTGRSRESNLHNIAGKLVLTGGQDADLTGGQYQVSGLMTTNAGVALEAGKPTLYVDRALKLSGGAQIVVNSDFDGTFGETVTIGSAGTLVLDASVFTQAEALTNEEAPDVSVFGNDSTVSLAKDSTIKLVNVRRTGEIVLAGDESTNEASVVSDSVWYAGEVSATNANVIDITFQANLGNEALNDRFAALFARGLSDREANILDTIAERFTATPSEEAEPALLAADGAASFTDEGLRALEQATGGNVTAGVFNVAYDTNALVTDTLTRRLLNNQGGTGLWVDAFYAQNEAKTLYGTSGYASDISGAMFGADTTIGDGLTAGAALAWAKADTDAKGVLANSLDSDVWGLSVYAGKTFGKTSVKFDAGYLNFANDFSGLGDASDAWSATLGARADWTAYANDVMSVVPHAGLRVTRIEADAVAFNDGQILNVVEAPIGVTVSGRFETQGWKLAPSADVTVAAQMGEKDLATFGSLDKVNVIQSGVVTTTIGLEATKDAFAFGLNAAYGFGPDDRANAQVKLSAGYRF